MPLITDWISAASSLIGALVAVGALWAIAGVKKQISLQRRQLKLDLEHVYVSRYWTIMDDLIAAPVGSSDREIHIERYLRLSEDQCDLRARKRITNSTWRYWRTGILEQLADEATRMVLEEQRSDSFVHLRRLSQVATYDPLHSPAGSL